MYMLPTDVALEDVPDLGGTLMQWHVHDNLCFTTTPGHARRGLTQPDGTAGRRWQARRGPDDPRVDHAAPVRSVRRPRGCRRRPVAAGEEKWCDNVHGS